jgi:hypothetical protein
MGRVDDTWQVLREPLHPQAIEIDLDDLSGELPAPDDLLLCLCRTDRCRVLVRVRESLDSARGHLKLASHAPELDHQPSIDLRQGCH